MQSHSYASQMTNCTVNSPTNLFYLLPSPSLSFNTLFHCIAHPTFCSLLCSPHFQHPIFLSLLYSQWYPLGLNLKKRVLVLSLDSARSADQHSHLLTLFWIARVWSVLLLHRWKTCDTHARARTAVTLKGQLKLKLNEKKGGITNKKKRLQITFFG